MTDKSAEQKAIDYLIKLGYTKTRAAELLQNMRDEWEIEKEADAETARQVRALTK